MKKLRWKKVVNFVNNRKKLLLFGLVCFIAVVGGFLAFQGYVFYRYKAENNKLKFLKDEYQKLISEIDEYKFLKSQYEIVLNENGDLNSSKENLELKINNLNSDISGLENKISEINKKIKNLS